MNGKLSVPFFAAAAVAGAFMFAVGIQPSRADVGDSTADAAIIPTGGTYTGYPTSKDVFIPVYAQIAVYCKAIVNGEDSDTFSGQIDLGNLRGDDLKLNSSLEGSFDTFYANFQIECNGGPPTVTLSATSMVGENSPTDGATYTNTVSYRARAVFETTGPDETVEADSGAGNTQTTLNNSLSNALGDLTVYVDQLDAQSKILMAGDYGVNAGGDGGVISITISPNT